MFTQFFWLLVFCEAFAGLFLCYRKIFAIFSFLDFVHRVFRPCHFVLHYVGQPRYSFPAVGCPWPPVYTFLSPMSHGQLPHPHGHLPSNFYLPLPTLPADCHSSQRSHNYIRIPELLLNQLRTQQNLCLWRFPWCPHQTTQQFEDLSLRRTHS